jgi:hypothetical protein
MGPAHTAPRIFVSYARSDGKKVAAELRSRLQDEHGFSLWQDLADMEGGKNWWQQITQAIDHVEYLVLVMTPKALASPIVRKEWRYARQQGKCVIPVVGANDLDFDSLPGWMKRAHFVDPGGGLGRLRAQGPSLLEGARPQGAGRSTGASRLFMWGSAVQESRGPVGEIGPAQAQDFGN